MGFNMLSVIVPVYNSENYIERCINSIAHQTMSDLEIIIVDDGSTDKSSTLIDGAAKQDNRITVIHKQNEGLLSARLDGVRNARGDFIGFVDSDDYIEPDMFESMMHAMEDNHVDVVSTGIMRDYDDGRCVEIYDHYTPGLYTGLEDRIYPTMLYSFAHQDFGLYCNVVNKLFRRDLLLEVLEEVPHDITYGEDAAVFYGYMMKCKNIYIMDKSYYHYCIRNDSMCSTKDVQLLSSTYQLYAYLQRAFQVSEAHDSLMRQLKRYIMMIEQHNTTILYDIHPALLNHWEFSVPKDVLDSPFVIYGAGGCGQAFFRYIEQQGKQNNVVAWVDRDYISLREEASYPLTSIDDGLKTDYEFILIAVKDASIQKSVKRTLVREYNVEPETIAFVEAKEYSQF